jgi:transketolase
VVSDDMRAAFGTTATALLDEDPRAAVVLSEISVSQYLAGAIARHPTRALNIGIMEQAMVGVAAGFAMEGFHPIAHSIAPFIAERPYEQLKLDFGYQGLGGTFVGVGGSYDYAAEGATHHAPADAALMVAIPGMEVLVPGHGDEVASLIRATYANGRPTYVRTSMATNPAAFDVAPGRMEAIAHGRAATVVAFGPMLWPVLRAVEGLDVTVLYATSLRPFDAAGLARAVGAEPLLITVEPFYEGTAAAAVTDALAHVPARYVSIGVPRTFIRGYGTRQDLDADVGLDVAGIRARIVAVLGT